MCMSWTALPHQCRNGGRGRRAAGAARGRACPGLAAASGGSSRCACTGASSVAGSESLPACQLQACPSTQPSARHHELLITHQKRVALYRRGITPCAACSIAVQRVIEHLQMHSWGSCIKAPGSAPAEPEPGAAVGQLVMRARGVDLQAEHTLVKLQRALQILHQQAHVVQALVHHARCSRHHTGSDTVRYTLHSPAGSASNMSRECLMGVRTWGAAFGIPQALCQGILNLLLRGQKLGAGGALSTLSSPVRRAPKDPAHQIERWAPSFLYTPMPIRTPMPCYSRDSQQLDGPNSALSSSK